MTTTTTGFAEIPWDVHSANNGLLDGLPPGPPGFDGPSCQSEWHSPMDLPGEDPWYCTRPLDHNGTHRAGNGTETLAEWGNSS